MRTKEVFQRLEYVIGISGAPRRLREVIDIELRNHFGLPPIQAVEKAEQLEEPIRQLISRNRSINNELGSLAILDISSLSDQIVQGSCYVEPGDSPDIAIAKRHRLHIEPILDEIHNLTFQQFERFGAGILKELGAKTVKVTPHSNDQGIDFYGLISLGQHSNLPLPFSKLAHDVTLGFVGQAKHYPDRPIKPEHIRELVGAVALARYKVFTLDHDPFENFLLLPFNPLVTMFFTTGYFTDGALELAEKSGIIARSGEQLAVFLADKGVGIKKRGRGTQFDQAKFLKWLNKYSA